SYNTHGDKRSLDDAQPMTSGHTLVPKNLFFPEIRDIVKVGTTSGQHVAGEVTYTTPPPLPLSNGGYEYSMIFPSDSMYNTPFQYSGAEKVEFVDYALVKLTYEDDNPLKSPPVV